MDNFEELQKPIKPFEIEWRIQSTTKNNKTILVPYINNRCVMSRMDLQFGANGWCSEFKELNGGFICRITILESGLYKEDGASNTKIEPIKGGISDSMKRCAVQFGLGRDLYKYPKVFLEGAHKYIPYEAYNSLNNLVESILDGSFTRDIFTVELNAKPAKKQEVKKPQLVKGSDSYNKVIQALKGDYTLDQVKNKYSLTSELEKELSNL
jgi:hypothetical protein